MAFDAAADIFSIGLVIHEVATGHALLKVSSTAAEAIVNMEDVLGPFDKELSLEIDKHMPGVFSVVSTGVMNRPHCAIADVDEAIEGISLTHQMIRLDPHQRPTLKQIVRTSIHRLCKPLTNIGDT